MGIGVAVALMSARLSFRLLVDVEFLLPVGAKDSPRIRSSRMPNAGINAGQKQAHRRW
jgi:hypothetical protein